jgi:hypothetical protein
MLASSRRKGGLARPANRSGGGSGENGGLVELFVLRRARRAREDPAEGGDGSGGRFRMFREGRKGASASHVVSWPQVARKRDRPQHQAKAPLGPRDGAFDPSAREVSVRVEGVTRTVPGPRRRAACPSWAPGSRKERRLPRAHEQLFARGVGLRRNGITHLSPGEAPAPRPALPPPAISRGGRRRNTNWPIQFLLCSQIVATSAYEDGDERTRRTLQRLGPV